jgi:uncharacterized protein (UPF0333 family)
MLTRLNRKKKGQSTLEYIILVAGVIAILIVFLGPTGLFRTELNDSLVNATDSMDTLSNRLQNSY